MKVSYLVNPPSVGSLLLFSPMWLDGREWYGHRRYLVGEKVRELGFPYKSCARERKEVDESDLKMRMTKMTVRCWPPKGSL